VRARGLSGLLLTALLALPALCAAQGLGDVAARAREERQSKATSGQTSEGPTYSNDDLEGLAEKTNEDSAGTVSTPAAAGGSSSGDPGGGGATRSPEPTRAAREKPFEDRVSEAQARVQALEASVEELQQRLNPMSTTYVYAGTGGPTGGSQADEEQRVRQQLAAAEQQLGQARQQLSAAQGALDDARLGRSGPPPPPDEPGNY
jgi:hypothetical protein